MARYEWQVECDPVPANAQGTAHLIRVSGNTEAASEADVRELCRRVMRSSGNYEAKLRQAGSESWVKDDPVEIGEDGIARPGRAPRSVREGKQ